jgi:hypothetical protein
MQLWCVCIRELCRDCSFFKCQTIQRYLPHQFPNVRHAQWDGNNTHYISPLLQLMEHFKTHECFCLIPLKLKMTSEVWYTSRRKTALYVGRYILSRCSTCYRSFSSLSTNITGCELHTQDVSMIVNNRSLSLNLFYIYVYIQNNATILVEHRRLSYLWVV